MTVIYVLIALLLLGILITVHEFGHFITARLTGIAVTEYAIGFGPKLLSWKSKKYDTRFSLRALPLGGFCAFVGEDDVTGQSQGDPRAFGKQKLWKRALTVLMGPGMNFLLAFVVCALFFWFGGLQTVTGVDPYISQVNAAGPAAEAGLKDGDIITQVNGADVLDGTTETLLKKIQGWRPGDEPLTLTVDRGGETLTAVVTPAYDEADQVSRINVLVSGRYRTETVRVGLPRALRESWDSCVYASGAILKALRGLVTTGEGIENTSGPVGTVSIITEEVRTGGFDAFVNLLVVISINLGIMNLLPIPGLDGSRLLFLLLEAVRRKPLPARKEAIVNLAGMVLLLGLMAVLTFRDVINLFR